MITGLRNNMDELARKTLPADQACSPSHGNSKALPAAFPKASAVSPKSASSKKMATGGDPFAVASLAKESASHASQKEVSVQSGRANDFDALFMGMTPSKETSNMREMMEPDVQDIAPTAMLMSNNNFGPSSMQINSKLQNITNMQRPSPNANQKKGQQNKLTTNMNNNINQNAKGIKAQKAPASKQAPTKQQAPKQKGSKTKQAAKVKFQAIPFLHEQMPKIASVDGWTCNQRKVMECFDKKGNAYECVLRAKLKDTLPSQLIDVHDANTYLVSVLLPSGATRHNVTVRGYELRTYGTKSLNDSCDFSPPGPPSRMKAYQPPSQEDLRMDWSVRGIPKKLANVGWAMHHNGPSFKQGQQISIDWSQNNLPDRIEGAKWTTSSMQHLASTCSCCTPFTADWSAAGVPGATDLAGGNASWVRRAADAARDIECDWSQNALPNQIRNADWASQYQHIARGRYYSTPNGKKKSRADIQCNWSVLGLPGSWSGHSGTPGHVPLRDNKGAFMKDYTWMRVMLQMDTNKANNKKAAPTPAKKAPSSKNVAPKAAPAPTAAPAPQQAKKQKQAKPGSKKAVVAAKQQQATARPSLKGIKGILTAPTKPPPPPRSEFVLSPKVAGVNDGLNYHRVRTGSGFEYDRLDFPTVRKLENKKFRKTQLYGPRDKNYADTCSVEEAIAQHDYSPGQVAQRYDQHHAKEMSAKFPDNRHRAKTNLHKNVQQAPTQKNKKVYRQFLRQERITQLTLMMKQHKKFHDQGRKKARSGVNRARAGLEFMEDFDSTPMYHRLRKF